jgi:hypothetical protein
MHDEVKEDQLSLKALKKPVMSMFYWAKYRITHKQSLLSETQLLEKLTKLPDLHSNIEASKEKLRQCVTS